MGLLTSMITTAMKSKHSSKMQANSLQHKQDASTAKQTHDLLKQSNTHAENKQHRDWLSSERKKDRTHQNKFAKEHHSAVSMYKGSKWR